MIPSLVGHEWLARRFLADPLHGRPCTFGKRLVEVTWLRYRQLQTDTLGRQDLAPVMDQLLVTLPDRPDVAVQVMQAERVDGAVPKGDPANPPIGSTVFLVTLSMERNKQKD